MKKRIIWIGSLLIGLMILGGGLYAYQQQQNHEQSVEQKKKEQLAAKQASVQAEKELEVAQRDQIVQMPTEPTKPKDNIELGWSNENATRFVSDVYKANKNRPNFPKLQVVEDNNLASQVQLKKYFTAPYWALVLEPSEKPRQVFLKNNENHTVTMILTEGTSMVPVHQYVIDSGTDQMIKDKVIDIATSITTWNEF